MIKTLAVDKIYCKVLAEYTIHLD